MPYHRIGFAFARNASGQPILPRPKHDFDFVGSGGTDIVLPTLVKNGWTAGSSGNAKLVPVYAGRDSDLTHRTAFAQMKAGELPIIGGRRVFNAADPARLVYSAPVWTTLINGSGSAATITGSAGNNPDGSAGAVRVQGSRLSTASGYAGLSMLINATAQFPPYSRVIMTYWLKTYDGVAQTGVHINGGASGQGARVTIGGEWARYVTQGRADGNGHAYFQLLTFYTDGNTTIDLLVATDQAHCMMAVWAHDQTVSYMQAPEQQHPSVDYGFGALGVKYYSKTSGLDFNFATGVIAPVSPVALTTVRGLASLPAQTLSTAPTDGFTADFSGNYGRLDAVTTESSPVTGGTLQKLVGTDPSKTIWRMWLMCTTPVANEWYTMVAIIKAAPIKIVNFQFYNVNTLGLQLFSYNLNTKVLGLSGGPGGNYPQSLASNVQVKEMKNGWFMIQAKVRFPTGTAGYLYHYLGLDYSDGQTSYKGDGVNGAYVAHYAIYPMGNNNSFVPADCLIRSSTTSLTARVADDLKIQVLPIAGPINAATIVLDMDSDKLDTTTVDYATAENKMWSDEPWKYTQGTATPGYLLHAPAGSSPNRSIWYTIPFVAGIARYAFAWSGPAGAIDAVTAIGNWFQKTTVAADLSTNTDGKLRLLGAGNARFYGTMRRFRFWSKALKDPHLQILGK